MALKRRSLAFPRLQSFYLFDFSGEDLNDPIVVDVHHWFAAAGALEEKFECLCEGKSLAAWCLASVELVVFLVFEPGF